MSLILLTFVTTTSISVIGYNTILLQISKHPLIPREPIWFVHLILLSNMLAQMALLLCAYGFI